MNSLIDSDKFLAALQKSSLHRRNKVGPLLGDSEFTVVEMILSDNLKDIVDEPHHPSGMDRDKIKTRNELREELRNE